MPNIWLYKGASNPTTIILSDPTKQRNAGSSIAVDIIGQSFVLASLINAEQIAAISANLFGTSSVSASLFGTQSISSVSVGRPVKGFGINSQNPSVVSVKPNTMVSFSSPNFSIPYSFTADGWGSLGARSMSGQLLAAPGNGYAGTLIAVASGNITIPSSASIVLSLNQNYFKAVGLRITTITDPIVYVTSELLSSGTYPWQIVCRFVGSGGTISAQSVVQIGNKTYTDSRYSNRYPAFDPKLQLSQGIGFLSPDEGPFQAMMTQFEFQQ